MADERKNRTTECVNSAQSFTLVREAALFYFFKLYYNNNIP